jgi:ATP-dependent protease ClpP protease subunit
MRNRFLAVVLAVFVFGCVSTSLSKTQTLERPKTVVLTNNNHVLLSGYINEYSIIQAAQELYIKAQITPQNEPIYLVIDSPGGEMDAGMVLVQRIKNIGREVKTITIRSDSMAFFLVQFLGERLITSGSSMMAHAPFLMASCSERCSFPIEIRKSALEIFAVEALVAKRMKLTLAEYHKLTSTDLELFGEDAKIYNAADRTVIVQCKADLRYGCPSENWSIL